MKKLQVPLIVLVLCAVVFGMNTVADMQRKKAAALAKEAKQAKEAAELAAASKDAAAPDKGHQKPAFALPTATGPTTAPVKVEVFINNSNTCHQPSVEPMRDLQTVYGKLLRTEWYSTIDPKQSARADKLQIGCEAGVVIDGKVEKQVNRNGGKMLLSFRGPTGDKYKLEDLYTVINMELTAKGKKPPATALARAKGLGTKPVGHKH